MVQSVYPVYNACKGLAYPILSAIASCDHPKAISKGYIDGWQMLLDKHDDSEMVAFCVGVKQILSAEQCKMLLDGLAREYTEFPNWITFTDACYKFPNWKPGRESIREYISKTSLNK